MIEMIDMREARRGYEANMNVVEVSKGMLMQTINSKIICCHARVRVSRRHTIKGE